MYGIKPDEIEPGGEFKVGLFILLGGEALSELLLIRFLPHGRSHK